MGLASTVTTLQANLNEMPRSGGVINCERAYGGSQGISKGDAITWNGEHLQVSSAQDVFGAGPATRITYLGGPKDPPAFEIWSYTDNGYIDSPIIRDMQINCPNGGRAIGLHPSVKFIENLTLKNIVTNGKIDLPIESYHIVLDSVRMFAYTRKINGVAFSQQALRLDGECHTLRHVKLQGNVVDAEIPGMIELHGTCQFESFPWPEGTFASPAMYLGDWKGSRGSYSGEMIWFESHRDGTYVKVDNADVNLNGIGGSTPAWPWKLVRGAELDVRRPPNPGAVVSDGTARLFVRGVDKTESMVNVK